MAATCPTWKTRLCMMWKVALFKEEKLPAHISLNADCLSGSSGQIHKRQRFTRTATFER